jgi:hypothetical protein
LFFLVLTALIFTKQVFEVIRIAKLTRLCLASAGAKPCIFYACSKDRLEKLCEQQMVNKEMLRYDGCCRNKKLPATADIVVKFKAPLDGEIVFDNVVKAVSS